MSLIKQDILRTNKRYVTKIVGEIDIEDIETIAIGLTESAFLDPQNFQDLEVKLHSVMSTSDNSPFTPATWEVGWGTVANNSQSLSLSGVNNKLFFNPGFSLEKTGSDFQRKTGTVAITLNNGVNSNTIANGTIILEFGI
jgi:hypothetical protein